MADSPESKTPPPRRRGRRGGRGRGRRPQLPPRAATSGNQPADLPERQPENLEAPRPVPDAPEFTESAPPIEREPDRAPVRHGSAISQAIDEVTQVIESLKEALAQMEEVLELAELAERQKNLDEQEIESLRRAVRQIQRPRGFPPPRDNESRESREPRGPREPRPTREPREPRERRESREPQEQSEPQPPNEAPPEDSP